MIFVNRSLNNVKESLLIYTTALPYSRRASQPLSRPWSTSAIWNEYFEICFLIFTVYRILKDNRIEQLSEQAFKTLTKLFVL